METELMTTVNLQLKKRIMLQQIQSVAMKALEYADACRDSNDDVAYKEAVAIHSKISAAALK